MGESKKDEELEQTDNTYSTFQGSRSKNDGESGGTKCN